MGVYNKVEFRSLLRNSAEARKPLKSLDQDADGQPPPCGDIPAGAESAAPDIQKPGVRTRKGHSRRFPTGER